MVKYRKENFLDFNDFYSRFYNDELSIKKFNPFL